MKKQVTYVIAAALVLTTTIAFGAKYKVNTSGVIKNSSGQTISSPANAVNQTYFNQYGNLQQPATNVVQPQVNVFPVVNYTNTQTQNTFVSPYTTYYAGNYVSQEQVNKTQVGIIEFVMDYSGSMSNWIVVAKRSMSAILNQIPNTTKVGFRVFGHDSGNNPTTINTVQDVKKIIKQGNKFKVITERGPLGSRSGICASTQMVSPLIASNAASIISGMNSVGLGGATPMVYALDRAAYQDFANLDTTSPKKIVLITDGGENCGGDPCAFAKSLMKKRSDIHIDVVLVSSNSKSLSCLSSTTGGHFYNVNDLSNFSTVVTNSMQSEPTQVQNKISGQKYEFIGE